MSVWKAAALIIVLSGSACSDPWSARRVATMAVYDPATGRLSQLAHDSNRNGITDTWTDMDGARLLASRLDQNEDGRIDRWEYYDSRGRLMKVGFSRKNTGKPDGWAFSGAEGSLDRIELSSTGDESRIDRREFYQRAPDSSEPQLVRAEEDTNGDGRLDRWEAYESGELASVAWDMSGDGIPDRRLTWRDSRLVLIESGKQ